MMKVLMFGWEFPPHISGGLGTACFGLTQSLMKEKVKVLFVVPRLYGDETEKNVLLINASAIADASTENRRAASTHRSYSVKREQSGNKTSLSKKQSGMTYIEVAAALSPYHHEDIVGSVPTLAAWNYELPTETKMEQADAAGVYLEEDYAQQRNGGVPYLFSGTYGSNLMHEVQRYAKVAEIIAKKYSFDVIHAHDWMTFPAGIAAKRITKKPLVVHVHSTEYDRAGERVNEDVLAFEKKGFTQADMIITVSNWTKKIVMSRYHMPESKIKIIHNGISPKARGEEFSFPEIGSHFVTFLGRVTRQKGPRFFVEASHKVLEEFPEAHFIVAGAGDLLPQIIERVAQLNMSSNFHFTGFIKASQVDQLWSMTDVYVMPSVSEPFGIAPLEAIQGGVPVILSNQSGVSEVMPHAIKVDFWNVNALASAICSVLRYESLSNVLRQNSQQHIQKLTWDIAASNVNALYHDLIYKR